MEILYCWIIFIIVNHIIIYISWRTKTKEGTTFGSLYQYYTDNNPIGTFIFIIFIWSPLNFVPIICYIIIIISELLSNLRIR